LTDLLIPADFDIDVACEGETHRVEVREGTPRAVAHASEQEQVLMALGGEAPACVQWCYAATSAPAQIQALEDMLAGQGPARAASSWTSVTRQISARTGETPIDTTNLPVVFRRLGYLRRVRNDGASAQEVHRLIKRGLAVPMLQAGRFASVSFDIGTRAAVEQAGRGTRVVVAEDWLWRVWVFGREAHGEGVVLDVRAAGAHEVSVTLLTRDATGRVTTRLRTMSPRDIYGDARLTAAVPT
jgi:hypothetical protein